jgi:hypothetical protein
LLSTWQLCPHPWELFSAQPPTIYLIPNLVSHVLDSSLYLYFNTASSTTVFLLVSLLVWELPQRKNHILLLF